MGKLFVKKGKEVFQCGFMDHQGFTGIADSDPLGFGVVYNLGCHGRICCFIHIDVAVSGTGLNDRDRAAADHRRNQACASPGNQHIYVTVQLHKSGSRLPPGIGQKLDRIFGKAVFPEGFSEDLYNRQVGGKGVASAPQDYGISRFKAEAEGICSHIGPGFVDNADDSQGNPYLADPEAVGRCPLGHLISDGVRQGCYLPQSLCHIGNTLPGKLKAVQKSGFHALFFSAFHIFFIGSENGPAL